MQLDAKLVGPTNTMPQLPWATEPVITIKVADQLPSAKMLENVTNTLTRLLLDQKLVIAVKLKLLWPLVAMLVAVVNT